MRNLRLLAFLPLFLPVLLSCSGEGGRGNPEAISREAFIDAYVQLRIKALRSPREELSLEDRDQILDSLGLSDQQLLDFVEVHGRDVQFMRRVWEEVDSIFTDMRQDTRPGNVDPRGT